MLHFFAHTVLQDSRKKAFENPSSYSDNYKTNLQDVINMVRARTERWPVIMWQPRAQVQRTTRREEIGTANVTLFRRLPPRRRRRAGTQSTERCSRYLLVRSPTWNPNNSKCNVGRAPAVLNFADDTGWDYAMGTKMAVDWSKTVSYSHDGLKL